MNKTTLNAKVMGQGM